MTQQYGLEEYGGGEAVELVDFLIESHPSFLYGTEPEISSKLVYLLGSYAVAEQFTRRLYIGGIITGAQLTGSKQAHISGFFGTSTVSKNAFINFYGIILRSPTRDGAADPFTNFIDDTTDINNNGTTFNSPTWIEGPHG